ncbi:hypothetical protein KA005_13250, partial [bacterium]|nr:hypothetical protein [bacterium]
QDMPLMLSNGTAGIFTLFWMGLTFSNLSFQNLFKEPFSETLSMIPIGIARHTKDILQIFGSALLGLLVAGVGPLGIVYDSLWQYLLMIGMTGLLLGSNISRPDDPRMTPLITLGLSRSHLALGQTLRARYLATDVMSGKNTFGYEQLDWLAEVQRELLSAGRNQAIIEELAILSVDPTNNFENSGKSWPWQKALAILQGLAVKIEHQNTSIRLKTIIAASSVLITVIIGGLALAYLAMITQAY